MYSPVWARGSSRLAGRRGHRCDHTRAERVDTHDLQRRCRGYRDREPDAQEATRIELATTSQEVAPRVQTALAVGRQCGTVSDCGRRLEWPSSSPSKVQVGICACVFGVRALQRAWLDGLAGLGRERSDFSSPRCAPSVSRGSACRGPRSTSPAPATRCSPARRPSRPPRPRCNRGGLARLRDAMEALDRARVQAFIAKEASPTCGLTKARVGKRRTETGAGVFGAMLSTAAGSSSPTRRSRTR